MRKKIIGFIIFALVIFLAVHYFSVASIRNQEGPVLNLSKPITLPNSCPSEWSINVASYVIVQGEVIPLIFDLNNRHNSKVCIVILSLTAPQFDIDPTDTTAEIKILPNSEFKSVLWFITPKDLGQFYVLVDLKLPSNEPSVNGQRDMTQLLDEKGFSFVVNDIFGFNVIQKAWISIICAILGSTIFLAIFPDLLNFIRKLAKSFSSTDNKNTKQNNDADQTILQRQYNGSSQKQQGKRLKRRGK